MSNVLDRFNRANTNDTGNGALGTADTGQAWTVPAAGWRWGIVDDKAGRPNGPTDQAVAWIDAGESDVLVEATLMGEGGGYIGIIARATDTNNYLLMQCQIGSATYAYTRYGGVFNGLPGAPPPGAPAYGDRVGILTKGLTVSFHRNGVYGPIQNLAGNPPVAHVNATKHGLYMYSAGANRLEDFSVKTPEKTYVGAAWQKHYAKAWDGTTWIRRAVRRYDGANWK